jgi:hypothetical protein
MKMKNFKKILLAIGLIIGGLATITAARAATINTINFANYNWTVKSGQGGPGPNNWGNTDQDVFMDDSGLHLKVSQHADDQKWYSSEVYLPQSLGYGKYTFEINSDVNNLDQNLVAAPFLYQDDTHEIDIEHSYWAGESEGKNLYYTVQPFDKAGNQQSQIASLPNPFLDIIDWQPDKIIFSTQQNGNTISSFTYTSSTDGTTNNFTPGNEKVHINFWQYKGLTPINTSSHKFVIKNFTFDPFVAPIIAASSSTSTTNQSSTSTSNTTTSTTATTSTQSIPSSHLTIRYNDNIILNNNITLAKNTYHDVMNNIDYPLTGTSTVFLLLVNADQQSDNFSISDAQFNSGLNSFYVKCLNLNIATSTENKCNNWQYTVNGSYPSVGMDKTVLTGGENVYIYFGNRYDLSTEKTTFYTNETVTTTFREYDYQANNWILLDGKPLLATEPILPDYSNFPPATIVPATTINGLAYFNFSATGTYYLTVPNDYWPGVTISVTSTPMASTTATNTSTNNTGGGGSGSSQTNSVVPQSTIDDAVNKLINFLKSKQDNDGKIVDGNISDWVAMSFAAKNIYAADVKKGDKSLYNYIYNYNFTDSSDINLCASYPRHILALLSAGTDKNDAKINNLKDKINAECVKNNKFGQDGINDDVFGLLALLAIGQDINSSSVQVAFNAILSDQQPDGSFTWNGYSGADITGAVMDTLFYSKKKGLNFDNSVLEKAKQYLKNQQLPDGGWGFGTSDALTTSWVVMGINGTLQQQEQWFNAAGKNPWHILIALDNDHYTQSWDGNIDWFGTKHAIPALVGAHWPIILDPKPATTNIPPVSSGGGGGSIINTVAPVNTPTSTVTTTISTATTTVSTSSVSADNKTITIKEIVENNLTTEKNIGAGSRPGIAVTAPEKTKNREAVISTNQTQKNTIEKPSQELSAGQPPKDKNQVLDNLPLDTPTKKTAKKVLAVTGGSAAALGLYLGFRLLKNVL